MSDTASDLKSDIVKLVGEIDVVVERAEKHQLEKTLKAIGSFKGDMLKGMKLDYKPETFEFYRKKFETLCQVEQAELKHKISENKKLEEDDSKLVKAIDDEITRARKADAGVALKRLLSLKKDYAMATSGTPSRDMIELYQEQLDQATISLDTEIDKSTGKDEAEDDESTEKWSIVDTKAEMNTMQPAQDKKYKEFKTLIKSGVHPKDAAEQLGDSHYESVTGGFTIRLSKEHRVFFTISGNKVTVKQVGGHYPKTKK